MIQLGFNVDHVATVRQARYKGGDPDLAEPDPVRAAHEAELGGADGITVHLREDRRHAQDRDVDLLRRLIRVKLNLEMAPTEEMCRVAERVRPHTCMLVPEGRQEVTTEGGLDVAGQRSSLTPVIRRLKDAGALVSVFIDADRRQIDAASEMGVDICEVHTGPYAEAFAANGGDFRKEQLAHALRQVEQAGGLIRARGMRFNAGHALNYHNVNAVAALAGVEELHIGHAIVSRAIYVGVREAVRQMKTLMTGAASARRD